MRWRSVGIDNQTETNSNIMYFSELRILYFNTQWLWTVPQTLEENHNPTASQEITCFKAQGIRTLFQTYVQGMIPCTYVIAFLNEPLVFVSLITNTTHLTMCVRQPFAYAAHKDQERFIYGNTGNDWHHFHLSPQATYRRLTLRTKRWVSKAAL